MCEQTWRTYFHYQLWRWFHQSEGLYPQFWMSHHLHHCQKPQTENTHHTSVLSAKCTIFRLSFSPLIDSIQGDIFPTRKAWGGGGGGGEGGACNPINPCFHTCPSALVSCHPCCTKFHVYYILPLSSVRFHEISGVKTLLTLGFFGKKLGS